MVRQAHHKEENIIPWEMCGWMIHILLEKGGKTESGIDSDTKKVSSHKYFINEISSLLRTKSSDAALKFNRIKDLQDFRVLSDYKNVPISYDDCDKAIVIADKVRELLKDIFKV